MYQLVAKTFDCTEQSQIELADKLLYSLYTQLIHYNDEKNKEEEKNDVWLKKLHASPVKNLFTLLKEAQWISWEKSMEESYKEFMQEAEERQINLERYDIHTNSDLNEPYTKAFEDLIKRKWYIQLILDVIYRYVHGKTLSEYESNLITYLMDLVQKKPFSGKNN